MSLSAIMIISVVDVSPTEGQAVRLGGPALGIGAQNHEEE